MTQHYFTNIDDLYNQDESVYDNIHGSSSYQTTVTPLSTLFASAESKQRPPPCEIRCTDILNHIVMCPVCSKLYKEVEKNHSHQQQPHSHTKRENFLSSLGADNCSKLKTAVIVLGAILFIILLLWMKSKFMNNQGAKVASAFAPYMNRR
jgi:hypothetical protein